MRWATARGVRTNRAATAWLIRRFVDTDAEIAVVEPSQVAALQDEGVHGFDAPGAEFPTADAKGRTTFEQIAARYCFGDHALREMGRIVGAAEHPWRLGETPESPGLRAICHGFPVVTGSDEETLARTGILFDAMYATLTARMRSEPE